MRPEHLSLGELIAALEQEDPAKRLAFGFGKPGSYRGWYDQLAFEPMENVTVGEMLAAALGALEATYYGYKGGEFTMKQYTPCWLAEYGSEGESIGRCFLQLMLRAESSDVA